MYSIYCAVCEPSLYMFMFHVELWTAHLRTLFLSIYFWVVEIKWPWHIIFLKRCICSGAAALCAIVCACVYRAGRCSDLQTQWWNWEIQRWQRRSLWIICPHLERQHIGECVFDYCLILKIKRGIPFFQFKVLIKSFVLYKRALHALLAFISLFFFFGIYLSLCSGDKYRLFEHNCNTFTNEVAQFLTGNKIPSYITDLPSEVLSTWVC